MATTPAATPEATPAAIDPVEHDDHVQQILATFPPLPEALRTEIALVLLDAARVALGTAVADPAA